MGFSCFSDLIAQHVYIKFKSELVLARDAEIDKMLQFINSQDTDNKGTS